MPQFVEVALPVPMRQNFSYLMPKACPWPLEPGMRVRVPFGRQQLIGLVTGLSDECELEPKQLKPVYQVLDSAPLLPSALYQLTLWAARYYFCSQGQMLTQALPVALRKGADAAPEKISYLCLTRAGQEATLESLKRAPAQRKLLQQLKQGELTTEEVNALELSKSAIKGLLDKGWAEQRERSVSANLEWRQKLELGEEPHRLNQSKPWRSPASMPRAAISAACLKGSRAQARQRSIWRYWKPYSRLASRR